MKLNLGCGIKPLEGYVNIDIRQVRGVNLVDDAMYLAKIENGAVDEIYTRDLLMKFPWSTHLTALQNWNRVLKPGGLLNITLFDGGQLMAQLKAGRIVRQEVLSTLYGGVWAFPENLNKNLFTREWLTQDLVHNGFKVTDFKEVPGKNTAYRMSLTAVKVGPPDPKYRPFVFPR